MHVRPYCPEADHATLAEFWKEHGWPVVPADILSQDGFVVVDAEGVILAAGWLFVADSAPLGLMEYIVTNPKVSPLTAMRALDAVVDAILASARRSNVMAVYTFCRQRALSRLYQKHGFLEGDKDVTSLVYVPH